MLQTGRGGRIGIEQASGGKDQVFDSLLSQTNNL